MKHKFNGFSIPTGDKETFLDTIDITGNVESFGMAGPPP